MREALTFCCYASDATCPCQCRLEVVDEYPEQKRQMMGARPNRTRIGKLPAERPHASRAESENSPRVHSQYRPGQKVDIHTKK